MKLFISDVTRNVAEEVKPIAKYLGLENSYEEVRDNPHEAIRNYRKCLENHCVDTIANIIRGCEIYKGAPEILEMLKESGFKTIALTDDPLLYLQENQDVLREMGLSFDEFHTTHDVGIKILENNGLKVKKYTGRMDFKKPKSKIIEELVEEHKPKLLIGMFQGKNDEEAALTTKKLGGYVITVNSDSPLKEIGHHHVDRIEYAPEILKRILKN